jgi:hypothetical protein
LKLPLDFLPGHPATVSQGVKEEARSAAELPIELGSGDTEVDAELVYAAVLGFDEVVHQKKEQELEPFLPV